MIIAKFFGLIALGLFATIGYAVCVLILGNWVNKKYGNKIREWAKKRLPERFFADATNQRERARYNRSQESLCSICAIKEIQQWFEKSGKVCLVIQSLIHRTLLGKRGCHKNSNGYPPGGDRAKEYSSHNPTHHEESVSDFAKGVNQKQIEPILMAEKRGVMILGEVKEGKQTPSRLISTFYF